MGNIVYMGFIFPKNCLMSQIHNRVQSYGMVNKLLEQQRGSGNLGKEQLISEYVKVMVTSLLVLREY